MLKSKQISYFFLFVSLFFLFITIYKDRFVTDGNIFIYYKPYYVLFGISTIFSIISFYIPKNIKVNLILIFSSTLFSIYVVEFLIMNLHFYENYSRNKVIEKVNPNHDFRTKKEFFADLLKKNKNATVSMGGANFVGYQNPEIYPLSGISNKETVFCNENGYFAVYDSDRYGFKNPDEVWNMGQNTEVVFVGDSFTQGACVNIKDDIPGNFRKFLKSDGKNHITINLGIRGQGPLMEYAILKEYMPIINAKTVIQIFFENDLGNLGSELKNNFLRKYLDSNFKQNLVEKNKLKDDFVSKELDDFINLNDLTEKNRWKLRIASFLKVKTIRDLLFFERPKLTQEYKDILKMTKELVEKNGSNYILVYLPSHRNYRNSPIDSFFWKYFKGPAENHSPNHYQGVINLVKANNITLIDLHEELFKDLKDPYSVAPYGKNGHFNEFGYKLVAKKIYEKLNQLGYLE